MKNYSTSPSLLFLQQHSSEFSQNEAPDPSISLQMNETGNQNSLHSKGLETNEAQLNHMFSSGLPYLTPSAHATGAMNSLAPTIISQCRSSNAEKERPFGPPFQSDMLRGSRKRPLEDFVSRDGIFSMMSNTASPDQSQASKRKAIEQPVSAQVFKAPARRSQKLSDKITCLQKIVSPYGKTDTASVLQEACMYIKIAHQEIRRLKVSYFGGRPIQPQMLQLMHSSNLRSKGLCLAPLSMAGQLATEDSAEVSTSNQGAPKIMSAWGF